MMKLFKYELIKTRASKLIILGVTALLEVVFLIGLAKMDTDMEMLGASLLLILSACAVVWVGIQSVLTLHKDLNTKQSYMLFMTPNSNYRILGAKLLENGLSILLMGAFFCGLGLLDYSLLMSHHQGLNELKKLLTEIIRMTVQEISLNPEAFLALIVYSLTGWLSTVTIAYLAVIISTALLNGKKGNLVISFLIFIGLSILTGWLLGLVVPKGVSQTVLFLIRSGVELVFTLIIYFFSARIMERYLSV